MFFESLLYCRINWNAAPMAQEYMQLRVVRHPTPQTCVVLVRLCLHLGMLLNSLPHWSCVYGCSFISSFSDSAFSHWSPSGTARPYHCSLCSCCGPYFSMLHFSSSPGMAVPPSHFSPPLLFVFVENPLIPQSLQAHLVHVLSQWREQNNTFSPLIPEVHISIIPHIVQQFMMTYR